MCIAIRAAEGTAYASELLTQISHKALLASFLLCCYLHQTPHVIHCDIKASNILLDSDFQALLADLGFAKLIPDGATHVTTKVKGTLGYLAPEYAIYGKASESCDVYSFGRALLEPVSGKNPIEKLRSTVRLPITEWALPLAKRNFKEIVDLKLKGKYNEELKRMVLVAFTRTQSMPEKRPTMTELVDLVMGIPKEKQSSLENDMFEPETPGNSQVSSGPADSCSSISQEKDSRANANDIDS